MTRTRPGKSGLARTAIARSVLSLAVVILNVPRCLAQDARDWQVKAGGKMSFDAASVKLSKLQGFVFNTPPRPPTFSFGPDDAKPVGGHFYANFTLSAFIEFAYKLMRFQTDGTLANAPKWLRMDRFEIEAEAQGNPTKDQMRLMMQSLLADRFKLALHFETKELPVVAVKQVKAGKLGPKLLPHSQGPPCPEYKGLELGVTPPDPRKEVFPRSCVAGDSRGMPDGSWFVGSRNTTMAIAVQTFYTYGSMAGELDRPVVDQTGLDGTFDFVLEYKWRFTRPGAPAPADEFGGTTFVEALREQLGLKLVRTKAPVRTLVIDHVERPSEN